MSRQLILAGIDAVSAHSLKALGDKDNARLRRATEMGRVLCTSDVNFLILAQQDTQHGGIIFGQKQAVSIGDWVQYVRRFHATKTADEAAGNVFFVERR